jgi:hypothetical protein
LAYSYKLSIPGRPQGAPTTAPTAGPQGAAAAAYPLDLFPTRIWQALPPLAPKFPAWIAPPPSPPAAPTAAAGTAPTTRC